MLFFQVQNPSSPEEDRLINLWGWRCRSLLLLFVARTRSCVQTAIPLASVAFLRVVIDAARNRFGGGGRGGGGGRVVIVGDRDLFILFRLQLALIEAECPFKNVFDLRDKQKRHARP